MDGCECVFGPRQNLSTAIKLKEATVTSSGDVLQAAQALVSRGVQAFYFQGDNTVAHAFDVVVKAANDAGLPLFNDDPDFAARGAVACVGVGYYESGFAAARPIVRVLSGESLASIPIENVSPKRVILNKALAKRLGLNFPPEIVAEAAKEKAAATPGKASSTKSCRSRSNFPKRWPINQTSRDLGCYLTHSRQISGAWESSIAQ